MNMRTPFQWIRKNRLRATGLVLLLLTLTYLSIYILETHKVSPATHSITLDETRKLAYTQLRQGSVTGKSLLLVHGAPADVSCWDRLAETLPNECEGTVYAVDRLGYGNSDAQRELSLAAHAEAIHRFIADKGILPVVVGHSYGGPVVLRLAADYPDSIAGIVIVAGAVDPYMNDTQGFRRFIDSLTPAIPPAWATANAELLALTEENRAMMPALAGVTCPVTVIHGTWDPVCPYSGSIDYLQRSLSGAEAVKIRTLEHTGHNIHLSHPEIIAEETIALLSGPKPGISM